MAALVFSSISLKSAMAGLASISPAPGFAITHDGNDGRYNGTAVPTNIALVPGNNAFGSSEFNNTIHAIVNINDAVYGNSNSWISNFSIPDPDPRIGVGLPATFPLTGIAWGRANNNSHQDRTVGTYTLQYTTDPSPSLGSTWTNIGTVTYDAAAGDGAVGGTFDNWWRHEYSVSQGGSPIMATGVRVAVSDPNIAIDELELYYDEPAISSVAPVAWYKEQGAVLSGVNVTRWGDRSGNANDAAPGGGAGFALNQINGLPAVTFNGVSQHLDTPSSATLGINNSDYEIYVVAQSASGAIQFLTAGGGGVGIANFELHLNGSAGARFIPSSTATPSPDIFADIGAAGDYTDGKPHLFHVRVDGNTGYIAVNGVQSPDTVGTAQSAAAVGQVTLGVRGDASFRFDGSMGEVLIFNQTLTPAERSQVEVALQDKWEFLYNRATGGTMNTPNNIALTTNGGTAFAKDLIGNGAFAPTHTIPNLNDGLYGNSESWIGNSSNTFAGVAFAGLSLIDQIAFGRDNTGTFTDRTLGSYELQYTTVANPDASTPDGAWTTLTVLKYFGNTLPDSPSLRHLWDIAPTLATGIRIKLADGSLAIDEIEVYGVVVPEPSTFVSSFIGILTAWGIARRRRRKDL